MTPFYNIKMINGPSPGLPGRATYEVRVTQPCGAVEFSFWDRKPFSVELNAITCQCTDCKAMADNARRQREAKRI